MSWRFWERGKTEKEGPRLRGPRNLPPPVGRVLVVEGGENPDWVWKLKCLERPGNGEEGLYNVRIFDENSAGKRKISVRDYTSLDSAPELILFEGWFNKKTNDAKLEKKNLRAQ
jgi:hypothetical protein